MHFLLLLITFFLLFPASIQGFYDPLSVSNNKYGIHIADPQDIPEAANLVNSNGDWGYITVVIQDNDRNTDKWQRIFDQMRRLHVIPLVRIATRPVGNSWKKPAVEDIRDWKSFLNSLNWPTENRYVIIFNEPNHAAEWGNSINPEEYADILATYAAELKAASDDYFILPAGLDASAPNSSTTMDEEVYIRRMTAERPNIFALVDGWTSHSYPNPNFAAPPQKTGRISLRTYNWELGLLQSLGETRSLPIFITETGWQHRDLHVDTIAEYLETASAGAWSDPRIVAITPFIFNYQGAPFDHFSWVLLGGEGFYSHYYTYRDLPKKQGLPKQHEKYEIIRALLPIHLVGDATTTLIGEIKNTGQGILNPDGYQLIIQDQSRTFKIFAEPVPLLEPGEKGEIIVHITTPIEGSYDLVAELNKGNQVIQLESEKVTLVPPPKLSIEVSAAWRPNPTISDATVLVYDERETIVHEFRGLTLANGKIIVGGLKNIVPDHVYRVVVLVPGYLPRQAKALLYPTTTNITVDRLLPFDFDLDGKLSMGDFFTAIKTRPHDAWYRFFGP